MDYVEIQQIPGTGRGLKARKDIVKGTCIIRESPLLAAYPDRTCDDMEQQIAKTLKSLSKDQQRLFLSFDNHFAGGKHVFSGVINSNALPCSAKFQAVCIYPTITIINHCCKPNAHDCWDDQSKQLKIHALRDIKAGEEITITYIKTISCYGERQNTLKKTFGFNCSCSMCSLPIAESQASDTRRHRIEDLDKAIGCNYRLVRRPHLALADCHALLSVLEEEYGGLALHKVSRAYHDAYRISIFHSDETRAAIFAKRAYEAVKTCEGEDSPDVQKARLQMDDPKSHPMFGLSTLWKSTRDRAPKSLTGHDYEKWLWRNTR